MRRGEIYWVDFEPSVSGEPARTRPAVILTNDLANETLPHLMVAPITSNVDRQYPFDVLLLAGTCGLTESSRVQLNYLRGLNRSRIGRFQGQLTQGQMTELDHRLKLHIGLV